MQRHFEEPFEKYINRDDQGSGADELQRSAGNVLKSIRRLTV